MASTVAVLLLLSAGLFTVGFGDDCRSYFSGNEYKPFIKCQFGEYCCGTCNDRYCCSSAYMKLTDQNNCKIQYNSQTSGVAVIVSVIMTAVVMCVVFIVCCCCPCCCIYKMCRTPRTVVGGTHVTTVVNTQCIQPPPPVMQPSQYPAYKPQPTHPGYGAQPMQTGPYQGQPYAPGPPPPYHMSTTATYTMMPPAQPGSAYPHPQSFNQPAYNPAYVQPPNTGYKTTSVCNISHCRIVGV